jgi:HAE1 family hydrophobic/amphiphilic exporter-1
MSDQNDRKPEAPGGGGGLSAMAIRRPVFTTMLMLGLMVLGIFGYRRLPIDQFPEVDIPVVTVQTVYPGASPETIEREVSKRLEEAFNPVEGVDKITSISLEGVSQVIVEFDLGRDGDQASQDIRARIDAVRRTLPEDIEQPVVQKFDPSAQPIISLALSSRTTPIAELTTLADEGIRRQLESVSGVGQVQIAGGLAREVRVFIQPDRMQATGVSAQDVMGALQRQNLEVPAGRLESGSQEQLVRVTGRIVRPEQFGQVIVANRQGQPVRLADVARVEYGTEEERSLALVDGTRAVSMDVLKVSGANTVAVADGVNEAIARIQGALPRGTQLQVIRDNSVDIRRSVDDVIHELILGAFLTIVVVMLFLNDWKATAITALALPVSVVSSFILMSALGFTLNVLSLMALSLSIGILIDDAIVVIENIVRHREMGKGRFEAAEVGTREIFLAVMATTLSVVAVFVPVAFMGGIIGRFFFQFGMTVAWAVLVSLFVSFTLTPMLAAWWGVEAHSASHTPSKNPITRVIAKFNAWFDRQARKYRRVVEWALGHRKSTLGLAFLAFGGSVMLFPLIGGGFMPESDNSQFEVTFETPEGSSLSYTRQRAEEIGARLKAIPGVDYTYTTVGAGVTGTVTGGNVYVKLVKPDKREQSQDEVMVQARKSLTGLFGTTVAVLDAGGVGGAQKPLMVNLRGPDVAELQRISGQIAAKMKAIPGVVDIETSLGAPRPEFRIEVDRDVANDLALDVGQISGTVRPLLAGQTATTWQDPTGEERDVVVQVAPEQRRSLASLTALPVATGRRDAAGAAVTVPLGQIARIEQGTAPAQIDRQDLERVATVSAGTAPELSISEASSQITAAIADVQMPAGYAVTLGGETEQMQETVGYVLEAIILAIVLIFLILASQFESFTQPFAIMLSLPLSLIGVLLALLFTGDTFNMMSMIGLIMLLGLVVKNAILLVDNANERRAEGLDRRTALVEAGEVRLRPIMMTTLAMIFGMLPVAMAMGEGGGFRAPMARAVIGGLITSTLLTLVVVPVAYTYFDDFGGWMKRLFSPAAEREARRAREEEKARGGLNPEPVWGD